MIVGLGQTSSGAATIAATIQQVEGYYPGTPAYTNNNPGNLIYVGQSGATAGAGGFAAFPSYDAGYQALLNQIQSYANQGLTIQQMMNKYAPAGDGSNNPTAYANQIASALGVPTDTTVADAISGGSGTQADLTGTDSMTIPDADPLSEALTDFGSAFSTGDLSQISGQDYLIVGGILAGLWMLVAYAK